MESLTKEVNLQFTLNTKLIKCVNVKDVKK